MRKITSTIFRPPRRARRTLPIPKKVFCLSLLARKDDPSSQHSGTALAAATRFDSDDRRGSLDDITEADRVVGDESRQTASISLGVKSLPLTLGVMSGSISVFLSSVRYLLISRAITARK